MITISQLVLILTLWFPNNPKDCKLSEKPYQLLTLARQNSKVVSESQLIAEWNQFLDTDCPTMAQGDFNGDEKADYAVIITGNPYELVVVQSVGDSYEIISLMEIGFGIYDSGLGFGIETYSERILGDSLTLTTDAIYFEKFESSSSVYYWDSNQYKQYWMAD